MARTTEAAVRAIVPNDGTTSMTPFIDTANSLVDQIEDNDTEGTLDSVRLELIERWLSAYYYAIYDHQYASNTTELASATYQGKVDLGFDLNWWGQIAKSLDTTGFLSNLDKKSKEGVIFAQAKWLGKPPSGQIDYVDRD